jgi:lysophospholipase L1-like esterase
VANLPFLDAGKVIGTDGIDGIHFSAEAQKKLGEAVAKKVLHILQEP